MNMECVKLLIDPRISIQTCFLCFKQHEELDSIYTDLVIIKDHQELKVSVSNMVSYLFYLQDTVLHQVCKKCSDIIISIYILIQNHASIKQDLIKIAERLEKEVSSVKEFDKNCYLRIYPNMERKPVNKVKKKNPKIEDCPKCDMSFESKEELQDHKKIAHKNTHEAVICHICGKSCKTPSSLKAHSNCHKEKQCPYCSKMLKTHAHFRIHIKNHVTYIKRKQKTTKYNCHSCNFASLSKGTLDAHVNKAHLGVRPYLCTICSKGFYKKSNLTEHIHIHDKVKTETCEVCGDSFASKKTLMEHQRLHKNQKPYKCDICSASFVTSGRRLDHVKRKHMEKTECCLICNKMFSLKKTLNRHVKKMHFQCGVSDLVETVDSSGTVEMMLPFP